MSVRTWFSGYNLRVGASVHIKTLGDVLTMIEQGCTLVFECVIDFELKVLKSSKKTPKKTKQNKKTDKPPGK